MITYTGLAMSICHSLEIITSVSFSNDKLSDATKPNAFILLMKIKK